MAARAFSGDGFAAQMVRDRLISRTYGNLIALIAEWQVRSVIQRQTRPTQVA
jgi:hypothetical protein